MSPRTRHGAVLSAALTAWTLIALPGCSRRAGDVLTPVPRGLAAQAPANIPPDSWFAGPDANDRVAGWQTATGPFGGQFMLIADWSVFKGVTHTMLDDDSLHVLPKDRPDRKTFFEAYNDRLWLRQEGDTVHLNSWVILPSGGSDPDSPYSVDVITASLPPGPLRGSVVLKPSGPNGSPVGFRLQVRIKDAAGQASHPSETTTYPVFNPASVFHHPVINGYWGLTVAGKAYAVVRAVDGDGIVDRRVDHQPGDAVGIADRVDAGGGSAEDIALRSKILTFYVNHPPRLIRGPLLRPPVGVPISSRAVTFNVPADDDDPLDPSNPYNIVGGRGTTPVLVRRKLAIIGTSKSTGQKLCYIPDVTGSQFAANLGIVIIPIDMAAGPISIVYRLCDCTQCDAAPAPTDCPAFAGTEPFASQGTCIDTIIEYDLTAPDTPSIMGGGGGAGSGGGVPSVAHDPHGAIASSARAMLRP
jgi:hypothetical protein